MVIPDENIHENEMRFVDKSQGTLLKYASEGRFNESSSLEVKGFVLQKKQHFHSAFFYLSKAIKNPDPDWTESYKTTLKENLVETLIEASKLNLPNFLVAICEQWALEAEKEIEKLDDSPRKCDFIYKVVKIKTNKLMAHDELQMLNSHRLKFERVCLDIMKQNLKNINWSLSEAKKTEKKESEKNVTTLCLEIFSESKRVLDRAMNVIKDNVFPSVKKSVSCSYPTPKAIESQSGSDLSTKMKMFLERKLQLKNFETELPNFFKYLLKKQPDSGTNEYEWLQDFCDIRNKLLYKVGAE